MPQELPGFYYDAEKNRYFRNKSPNFNSSYASTSSAHKSSIVPTQALVRKGLGSTIAKMLQIRELYGNVIRSTQGKYNFREEYTKRLVSKPTGMAIEIMSTHPMGKHGLVPKMVSSVCNGHKILLDL